MRELKGEAIVEKPEASVDIKIDAYIPNSYIADNDMKLDIYKRIRDAGDVDAVDALASELSDRFGKLPPEVAGLLEVQALRVLCEGAGVRRIGLSAETVEAEFAPGFEPKPGRLRAVLKACEIPLEFDARAGLTMKFASAGGRREALRLGRKVLKQFADSARV